VLGASFVEGVQSRKVAAQVKHFAANNQEKDRQTGSSNVDERTLREIYLPAFAAATKNAWSAMCAYNKVNGQFACENFPLLNDVLKDQWGFDGAVVSDYPATKSGVRSALAGLDQEFGGSNYFAELAPAVNDGRLARAVLDDHARRVLRMMFRAGSFDGEQLPYPAGVADLESLTGERFDAAAYNLVPQLIYMGSLDDNDSLDFQDGWDEAAAGQVNHLFGEDPISRWDDAVAVYQTAGANAQFLLVDGIGHDRKALQDYSTAFFKEILKDE